MRTIALETSTFFGSVAALEAGVLRHEISLPGERRTARSLAPGVESLLTAVGWTPQNVEAVAVTVGPGSFTGLRIGVTTAKTLAYAAGARVIGINSLEAIALAAAGEVPAGAVIEAVIDAHRNQFFSARYRTTTASELEPLSEVEIVDVSRWLEELSADRWLTGPALSKVRSELEAKGKDVKMTPDALWSPSASFVGRLAWRRSQAGRFDDPFAMVPQYHRPSYAEENRTT